MKVLCFSLISLYLAGMLSPKGFLPVLPPRSCTNSLDSMSTLLTVVVVVVFQNFSLLNAHNKKNVYLKKKLQPVEPLELL